MAESKRDYYEVLGIGKDADEAAIKKSIPCTGKEVPSRYEPGDAEAEKEI